MEEFFVKILLRRIEELACEVKSLQDQSRENTNLAYQLEQLREDNDYLKSVIADLRNTVSHMENHLAPLSADELDKVVNKIVDKHGRNSSMRIQMIKELRMITQLGLMEAKDLIQKALGLYPVNS